jgi:NAD(P)-dependent dehydrogenase (short-subunit alcohol dehydrogenase family)
MSSSQTIVLITGANQGIGFETAKNLLLSSPKYHILLGSRSLANGVAAAKTLQSLPILGTVSPLQLDVTSDSSVDAAAEFVAEKYRRIDFLINNAGIGTQLHAQKSARDAVRKVMETNVVGVVSVTEAFLPLLLKSNSPKLLFVSSTTGSMTVASDSKSVLNHGGVMDYRASKAALNMLMVMYWNRLKGEGVKVWGVNPGLIGTGFHGRGGESMGSEPAVGGERLARVVRGERDDCVGKVVTGDEEGGILAW